MKMIGWFSTRLKELREVNTIMTNEVTLFII